MKKTKFTLALISFLFMSIAISAQNGENKKFGERMTAQFDKMATDLGLTAEQKATVITLSTERMKNVAEKMKAATTDEERKEIRKAGQQEYNQKLDDAFGKELADKMRAWLKENAPQRPQRPQ